MIEPFWNAVFHKIQVLFEAILRPFVVVAKALGYDFNSGRIWLLLVALCCVAAALAAFYDEIVLAARGRRVSGKVVGIDPGDEAPDRPIIRYQDRLGRSHDFISNLRCTAATRTIGALVDIVYDPSKPKRAREEGRALSRALSLAFWMFLGVFPVALFLWAPEMT